MRMMRQAAAETTGSAADAVRDERLEQAYLCALLRGARVDDFVVPPEALANPLHRTLCQAITQAAKRLRVVDVPAVRAVLSREGASQEAVELAEMLGAGDANPANIGGYVSGLLEYHAKRTNIRAMEEGIRALANPATRVDVVSAEVAAVLGATSTDGYEGRGGDMVRSLRADIVEARDARGDPKKRRRAFIATPFTGFNRKDSPMRGFPCRKGASALAVIAARSGIGKTALMSTLLHYWVCVLGLNVGLVGLEDGVRWLIERWAARDFGLDWGDIVEEASQGTLYVEADRLPWFPKEWTQPHPETGVPCFTLDTVLDGYEALLDKQMVHYSGPTIASPRLLALARKWIRQGTEILLVDHGLRVDYTPGADERLDLAIKKGINGLTSITVETGVPIVLAWHLNRRADEDMPPTMNDVKESGYLDADAALVLGMYRQASTGRSLCNVMKSRKSGGLGTLVELIWAGRSGMFYPGQCDVVDLRAEAKKAREAKKAEKLMKQTSM